MLDDIRGLELFYSDTCNFKCKYCYFEPKGDPKLAEYFTSEVFFDRLKTDFSKITDIGLWGGESTTNLPMFTKTLSRIREACPNLRRIMLSSNFSDITNVYPFLEEAFKGKHTDIQMQFSLDGDKEIFSMGRRGDMFERAVENFKTLAKQLYEMQIDKTNSYMLHNKATLTKEALRFLSIEENLNKHLAFFDALEKEVKPYEKQGGLIKISCFGTISFPYPDFNKDDGIKFATLLRMMHKRNKGDQALFSKAMHNLFSNKSIKEAVRSSRCSAGSSSVALSYDGSIHSCHQSFSLKREIIDTKRPYIAFTSEEILRFRYITGSLLHNYKFHLGTLAGVVKELSLLGYCEDITDDNLSMMIVLFIIQGGCYMDNVTTTGSYHLSKIITLVLLLCNGATEEIKKIWMTILKSKSR